MTSSTPRFFADLHAHPSLYGYNRMRQTERELDPQRYHLWQPMAQNLADMARAKRGATYAQADPPKLLKGRCKLTFASITPIERGFLLPSEATRSALPKETFKLLSGATAARAALAASRGQRAEALHQALALFRDGGAVRAALGRAVLGYGARRVRFMMSSEYDYWEDFQAELDFLTRRDGQLTSVHAPGLGPVTGRYTMLKDRADFDRLLDDEDDGLLMALTIEGAHTFSIDEHGERRPAAAIFHRIEELKELETPLLFLTLAHHFDNGLCGHAHSMPDPIAALCDQRPRLNQGFEPERDLGRRVARRLLSLDEALQDTGERRVLIDCKHMSALTRSQYYAEIIEPANRLRASQDLEPLPVIFSHASYSGVRTLKALRRDAAREDDRWRIGGHYAWALHCCDEDIAMILKTRGLFGLCFDQRVAGQGGSQHVHPEQLHQLLLNQLLGAVDAVMLRDDLPASERVAIWDCLCIGSDFDGMIDPVSAYPTALSLQAFAEDLRRSLQEIAHTRLIGQVGVDALVEKIAWQNATRFLERWLPDAIR